MEEKQSKFKTILSLFLEMLKIGAFTFGGGYAMLAILQSELVEKKKWIEKEDFYNMISIAESTPGPVAINSATYIGYKLAKFWGSFFATLGVVLPSFIIIFIISLFFDKFLSLEYVGYAFQGIQVCVCFLILRAGIKMLKDIKINIFNIAIFFITLSLMLILGYYELSLSPIFYILFAGTLAVIIYLISLLINKNRIKDDQNKEDSQNAI